MEFPGFLSSKPGYDGTYPVNLYLAAETFRGKPAFRTTPGLVRRVTPLPNVPIRSLAVRGEYLYALCGSQLYKISKDWVSTLLGTVSSPSGFAPVLSDDQYVVFRAENTLYVYDTTAGTLSTPSTNVTPKALMYQDRYFGISKKGSNFWYVCSLDDPMTWDPTDEGRASGSADAIVASISEARQLWHFKEESVEVYWNSGDADFPFQRIQGAHQEIGISAEGSLVGIDQSLFWLDSKWRIVRSQGYGHTVVSTPELERQIHSYTLKDDAVGYGIYWQGHSWYVINFPSANRTWAYDASTQSWFQWSSKKGLAYGGRHRGNCYAFFNGYHVLGDFENGKIYTLDHQTLTEDSEQIRWERTAPPVYQDGRRLFFPGLYIDMTTGTTKSPSSNPQVMMQYSDDDCHTWSSEFWGSVGRIGEYNKRVGWRRLGSSFSRTFRIAGTDAYATEIFGADIPRLNIGKE